jgi:hypothetical protein
MASENSTPAIAAGNPKLAKMTYEHLINLDLCPKSEEEATEEVLDCIYYLKNGTKEIDGEIPVHTIPRLAFIPLYEEAEALSGAGYYLTGLQMEFAVNTDNSNTYCIVFTPVRMYDGKQLATGSNYYSYTKKEGTSYVFDGTIFQSISGTQRGNYTAKYREKIQILHSDLEGDTHCGFIPGYDVNSMVFTFQELFNIMFDNRVKPSSDNIFTGYETEPIIIFNCVRKDGLNPNLLIKHGLLLSPNIWISAGIFEGAFGNLAHLCPPHCTNLVYYKF